MAEEEIDFYKDISDLKRDLESLKLKKDISNKDVYDVVQKLGQTITDMLEVFAAAADQMQLEEKSYDMQAKKQEMFSSKLDKLIDQNKTIAEGMVAIVDLVKENLTGPEEKEEQEPMFKPPQPTQTQPQNPFMPRQQTSWQPRPEPSMPRGPMMAPPMTPPPMAPQMPSMPGFSMPPMEPEPMPDFDFPEEIPSSLEQHVEEGQKKKGLFGMFKK